jgi:hypothetical protein
VTPTVDPMAVFTENRHCAKEFKQQSNFQKGFV